MRIKYICEKCGKTEVFDDPEVAFNLGWDYPPRMYQFGLISPRTCPNCFIDDTVWWSLVLEGKTTDELSSNQRESLLRILSEPESIMLEDE